MRFVAMAAAQVGFLLAEAWAFMILVGVIHAEWLPMMPTISFESAVTVALATTLLTVTCALAYGFGKEVVGE